MNVSKEELLHIAQLANLYISEEKVEKYLKNLDNILDYVEIIEKAPIENCDETIGVNDNVNAFRKDEVRNFENRDGILENAPEKERDMFKIPKVI